MEDKYCCSCEHYQASQFFQTKFCNRNYESREKDLVHGGRKGPMLKCEDERKGDCGPEGKFWEKKKTSWFF